LQLEGLKMGGIRAQQNVQNTAIAESAPLAAAMARYNTSASERMKNMHQISVGLGVALLHLSQLTYLSINDFGLEAVALQGLSRLQQLRELRLKYCQLSAKLRTALQRTLAQLPASLINISVKSYGSWVPQ
jgi:hypothetical protein